MKKLAISFLIFLFLLTLSYAILQGDIGKNWIRSAIFSALDESGYKVEIGQIDGTLPHQIDLKNISILGENTQIHIAQMKLRPILWRLIKREFAFDHIDAKEISFNGSTPLDLTDGSFRINRKLLVATGNVEAWNFFMRYHIKTKQGEFSASNGPIIARGDIDFAPKFLAHIEVRSEPFRTSIEIVEQGNVYLAKAAWSVPDLNWIGPVDGTATATYQNKTLKGVMSAANLAKGEFNLTFQNNLILGTSELNIENLQSLHLRDSYGKMQVKILRDANGLQLDTTLTDFYYKDLYAQKISLHSDLSTVFETSAEHLKWKHLELERANFETTMNEESSPYQFFAEGTLRSSLEVRADGNWNSSSVQIDHFEGTFFDSPFALNDPVTLSNPLDIQGASLTVGKGSAHFDIHHQEDETTAKINLTAIPIDFLSLNPLEVDVAGTMDLKLQIKEKNDQLQGTFEMALNQTAPQEISAEIQGSLSKNLLKIEADLSGLAHLDANLPIHLSLWPFSSEILYHKPVKGHIVLNTQVEEILDYFDLGSHKLSGHLFGNLSFSNTLYRPNVQGQLTFEDGVYENYYTGTSLNHIDALILAEDNHLLLTLKGEDLPSSGTIEAKGELHLLKSDLYPFHIDVDIQNFLFSQIDLVQSTATGQLLIEGNTLSALAKGDLLLSKTELTIPDHTPRPLPHLEVNYRNAIRPVAPPEVKEHPYPLRLDINVTAPSDIAIEGRGLESNWKGQFHLGGTASSLAAKGTIELIDGSFRFSSREFKLTEGSIYFSGTQHQMPYINLLAEMETKGIVITARLKGPLDDPQITLLSNPPLPLSSIISYLLFGQDLSEITGSQALEIASSLASLAGTGPDVMESARKSLGVDRLQVVSQPTEDGETVALLIGKYITEGVLITFTQGAEDSSTQISVEIELKNNFVFQIENDQHQEQGKFTLKWNLNY